MEELRQQQDSVGLQQLLCGVAIVLLAGFGLSRGFHWAELQFTPKTTSASEVATQRAFVQSGSSWNAMGTPFWIYAFAVLGANALYLFWHRQVDQLVPAIANAVIGGVLSGLTIWFIIDPDVIGSALESKNLLFSNHVMAGVIPALICALGLLLVGFAQIVIRQRGDESAQAGLAN